MLTTTRELSRQVGYLEGRAEAFRDLAAAMRDKRRSRALRRAEDELACAVLRLALRQAAERRLAQR
jgi:hypothetical protein